MWFILQRDLYSGIKRNEPQKSATIWVNLKAIMLTDKRSASEDFISMGFFKHQAMLKGNRSAVDRLYRDGDSVTIKAQQKGGVGASEAGRYTDCGGGCTNLHVC